MSIVPAGLLDSLARWGGRRHCELVMGRGREGEAGDVGDVADWPYYAEPRAYRLGAAVRMGSRAEAEGVRVSDNQAYILRVGCWAFSGLHLSGPRWSTSREN